MRAFSALVVIISAAGCTEEAVPAGPAPTEPWIGCAAGEREIAGECVAAGVQDNGCPAGEALEGDSCLPAGIVDGECGFGFVHDGDRGCVPVLPDEPCEPGHMALPGDEECRALASCGTSRWDDIPATWFVDAAHGGPSDGTMALPYTTLQDAIDAASDGDVIAIAEGSYAGALVSGKGVTLWGRCPELVSVTMSGGPGLRIEGGADGTVLREIALAGDGAAVVVVEAADVVLESLWVHDTTGRGLDVSEGASVTVRGTLIENASDRGIYAAGATLVIEEVHVRDTQPRAPDIGGRGINVRDDPVTGVSGSAQLSRVHVERNSETGIMVHASYASITESVVRHTQRANNGRFGRGISVQLEPTTLQGSEVELVRSAIVDNIETGVTAVGSTLTVTGTVIARTATDEMGGLGWGLAVQSQPNTGIGSVLSVSASLIEDNHTAGAFIGASEATLTRVVVRGTQPAGGVAGRGIVVQHDAAQAIRGDMTLRGSLVEDNHESGVHVEGSRAELDGVLVRGQHSLAGRTGYGITVQTATDDKSPSDAIIHACTVEQNEEIGVLITGSSAVITAVAIRDTLPSVDGFWGMGLLAQRDPATLAKASVSIESSAVEDHSGGGVAIVGSDGVVRRSLVSNTLAQFADGTLGDGVAVVSERDVPASLVVTDTLIRGSARAGLGVFGAAVQIGGVQLECNVIDLDGEALYGEHDFYDLGNNSCGCADVERTCKMVSSMLEAPLPVPEP